MAEDKDGFVEGFPVEGFPLRYRWHGGEWERIFDRQIALVRRDVMRARLEERLVIYLSVPISRRGGSFESTNVDIAMATERRLLERWGEAVWILNPARYQMESKGGFGLIEEHARAEKVDLEALLASGAPTGGDYMRMWTKVLVEDGADNASDRFDAFYFLGPSDVHAFFDVGPISGTRAIQAYFASRYATDSAFHYTYSGKEDIDWGKRDVATFTARDWEPLDRWEALRAEFVRFYLLRASANFSLGCRDEWNIWVLINRRRLDRARGNVGDFMPAYFDGRQVDPAGSAALTTNGYGTVVEPA